MSAEIVDALGGGHIVLVDGVQHGGNRDCSGAGDLIFSDYVECIEYIKSIGEVLI